MPTRRGVSLGELLLTMSACTVILTMSASLIHRAMHTQSKTRAFFDVERSAQRLAASFRQDVHAAQSATTEGLGEGALLRLELPGDQTVEYRLASGRVERVLLLEGVIKGREMYVFPEGTEFLLEQQQQRLVVLSLVPPPEKPAADDKPPRSAYSVPVSLRAVAVLRRHPTLIEAREQEQSP